MAHKSTIYSPIIKVQGFNPSPVAGKIPSYANSILNPRVVGTSAHISFWEEQINFCINGYKTGGILIPGRYYFFLNFMPLQGLYGLQYPFYVDMQYQIFKLFEFVKNNKKKGVIYPKARRKGFSEIGEGIFSHGLRFIEGYRGALAAGIEQYVTGFRKKFDHTQSHMPPEFRLNLLTDNDKIHKIGYTVKSPVGGFIEDGSGGQINFETLYDDPTKLEGEYFNDVLFEESGRFKKLGEAIESIGPALQFGSQSIGTQIIQGTGGNILSTSKDFKEYLDAADTLGYEVFVCTGDRMYFPFFGNRISDKMQDEDTGEMIDAIPNLKKYEDYQIIGCEDTKAAKLYIEKKTAEYAALPNKKRLKLWRQAYPLTLEDMFASGGSNNFNDEKLYDQLFKVEGDTGLIKDYVLDWVYEKDSEGVRKIAYPLRVEHRPAKPNDKEYNIIKVYQLPRPDIKDLDVGGVDSYNQDQTQTTKSLGAMIVERQGIKLNMELEGIHKAIYPVALYYCRPPRKEIFYENSLKMSVWYGLIENTMCSAEQEFIIDYYNKNHGTKYLAPRPKTFDSPNTQQVHKWGAKMTIHKDLVLGMVQSHIEDYCEYIFFADLIRDYLAYDEEYIGTDWDAADASALAKMRIEDMKRKPRLRDEPKDLESDVKWMFDKDGNAILIEVVNKEIPSKTPVKYGEGSGGGWRSYN